MGWLLLLGFVWSLELERWCVSSYVVGAGNFGLPGYEAEDVGSHRRTRPQSVGHLNLQPQLEAISFEKFSAKSQKPVFG